MEVVEYASCRAIHRSGSGGGRLPEGSAGGGGEREGNARVCLLLGNESDLYLISSS